MQEERGRADVLGACTSGRSAPTRSGTVSPSEPKIAVRERREQRERERGQHAAGHLQLERPHEQAAQLPPLLADDVAEPELRQRLLDGQVEQHLEEADRDERGHEDAEVSSPRTRAATTVARIPKTTAA